MEYINDEENKESNIFNNNNNNNPSKYLFRVGIQKDNSKFLLLKIKLSSETIFARVQQLLLPLENVPRELFLQYRGITLDKNSRSSYLVFEYFEINFQKFLKL